MDFKAMLQPVRFTGKPTPQENGVPAPLLRRQDATRRLAMLREARAILAVLPGPGESLHAIMSGRYDLADLIEALLDARGPVEHLRIATLSFNSRNVEAIGRWLESDKVTRFAMLCSHFFQANNPETFEALRERLAQGQGHRLAASRNHCKVCCMLFKDGGRFALEGSANLRTNSNNEQFALFNDAELHDWHAAWIDDQVSKHEGNENRNPATG
jgi:hypothetical protein